MKQELHSYKRVWKVEKKIYAFQNLKLPVPVVPAQLGYFVLTLAAVALFDRFTPFISFIPPIIKYLALPFGLTQFLMKKKLDGKNPLKYFVDYIRYLSDRSRSMEFFRPTDREARDVIQLKWDCTCRNTG
jgi:hypothetical protein